MSSILEAPPSSVSSHDEAPVALRTLEDLLNDLGGILPSRVRLAPPVGGANEESLLAPEGRYCELVDGTLVEKGMGFFESRLASILYAILESWLAHHNIGFTMADGAMTRLQQGLVRIPDACFFRWDRVGSPDVPQDPICGIVPNLAVEVVSRTNTRAEIDRKRREYFEAGVELVWIVYPETITVEVWTTPRDCHIANLDDTLDGGSVLPGFSVSIRDWFQRAKRGQS